MCGAASPVCLIELSQPVCPQGVGGSDSKSVRMESSKLLWLEMGASRFERLKCLLAGAPGPGLDLSHYTAGILCGDLLARCRLVFDYARRRVAIIRDDEE